MRRVRNAAPEYWFELLIAVMAIAGMLELVVGRDSPGAPGMSLWFSIPAVAILVLPLFVRRRFPFAAPAAYWLIAAALTYVDGLLIPFIGSLGVIGLATAFLLGNLRDNRQAGAGLAIVLGCIVVVVSNIAQLVVGRIGDVAADAVAARNTSIANVRTAMARATRAARIMAAVRSARPLWAPPCSRSQAQVRRGRWR